MANEATMTCNIQIRTGNLNYSRAVSFRSDVSTAKGPTPGMLVIPTSGRDIYFTELTTPGLCMIQNLDEDNYIEMGVYDPQTHVFYPLLEWSPGEAYLVRFSRNLQEQYAGSGTGTTSPENYLRMKANRASCNVQIEAFEK